MSEEEIIYDKEETIERIKEQINSLPIILYMKGNPDAPLCGFSQQAVEHLKALKKPFAYVNILQDEAIRQYLPEYADWATFPQLWVEGKLVGGADIIAEMAESGELAELFNNIEFDWDSVDED
ncbi:MAG: Grx4 family monothiol glutaredoxin [Cardiobacteriaceae bacterium]|nr:Grx4 family monothiol glutaredoxin [Cardiobacteriaceae bacterium]